MKQLLMTLLLLPLFIACSNDDIDSPVLPKEKEDLKNKYTTGVDLSTSYPLTDSLPTFKNEVFHALGYGYDITGKYAHPDWIRKKVLDPQKFENDHYYDVIHHWRMFYHRGLHTLTGTKEEIKSQLLENLNITTNDASTEFKNAFNGILDMPFSNDTTYPDLKYYYAINAFVSSWYEHHFMLYDNDDLLLLCDYLTDEFKSDLNSKTANEIIKLYGTHVMVDIEVGWRQDYYFRSSSDNDLEKRMTYASAKFIHTTPGIWMSPGPEANYEKENLYTEYISGVDPIDKPIAWLFDITNYSKKPEFEIREHNIDTDHLVLVNWGSRAKLGPIIPIYEFISDLTKKDALLQAYQEYLNN